MSKIDELLSVGGLSLDRLRNFCLIAEAGGLTRASGGDPARLSLYSRQIKELETFFGCELKRRSGKGIALTDAGRELAQLARAHLLGLDDFKRAVRAQPQRISIAAGNSVLEWLLLPRLAQLRARLPGAIFEFHSRRTDDIIDNLRDLTLDLGIVREEAVSAPLKKHRLQAIHYSLFVPAKLASGHPECRGRSSTTASKSSRVRETAPPIFFPKTQAQRSPRRRRTGQMAAGAFRASSIIRASRARPGQYVTGPLLASV